MILSSIGTMTALFTHSREFKNSTKHASNTNIHCWKIKMYTYFQIIFVLENFPLIQNLDFKYNNVSFSCNNVLELLKSQEALTIFLHKHFANRLADSGGCSKHGLLVWALPVLLINDVLLLHFQFIGTLHFGWPRFPPSTEHTMGQRKNNKAQGKCKTWTLNTSNLTDANQSGYQPVWYYLHL